MFCTCISRLTQTDVDSCFWKSSSGQCRWFKCIEFVLLLCYCIEATCLCTIYMSTKNKHMNITGGAFLCHGVVSFLIVVGFFPYARSNRNKKLQICCSGCEINVM